MPKVDLTLNPLVLWNMEFADKVPDIDLRDVDTILKDIGWDPGARTLSDCQARYQELREVDKGFIMAPAEKWIQSKVIAPLRQAKANYVLSNYLSTIALCGMTAEMAAMLIYDMMLVLSDRISESDQAKLTAFKKFQRKAQEKRIDHLMDFKCVGSEIKGPFDNIRMIRRRYLHFYLQDLVNIKKDALSCYQSAFILVKSILPHEFTGKGFNLSPALLEYLKKKGVAEF